MSVAYCSGVNTADPSFDAIVSDYQSMGRCKGNCTAKGMPLAILQWKTCWCSNLIPNPKDRDSVSSCENPCPGYPDDYCGGNKLYGYIELSKNGIGTAAPGGANPKTSSAKDDSPAATAPTVHTVTVGGVIKTVTATPTPTGNGTPELATEEKSSSLSTGATVGVAVSVIGVVAIAAIFVVWFFLKRKRRNAEEGLFTASRRGSSPGMIPTPKTGEVSENRFTDAPNPGPIWDVSSKRRSHLMPVDPRLDPFAKGIYVGAQNKSHESISSLQDNQDYSRRIQEPPRVLRAMNPDPDQD